MLTYTAPEPQTVIAEDWMDTTSALWNGRFAFSLSRKIMHPHRYTSTMYPWSYFWMLRGKCRFWSHSKQVQGVQLKIGQHFPWTTVANTHVLTKLTNSFQLILAFKVSTPGLPFYVLEAVSPPQSDFQLCFPCFLKTFLEFSSSFA